MPTFDESITTPAPPEDVWMLLYDPTRFPEWWTDFPMPQALDARRDDNRVTISCIVSDLVFEWRLEPVESGTKISVHVDIPYREAERMGMQREIIGSALKRLGELAAQPVR
jgi:hypothetical protein